MVDLKRILGFLEAVPEEKGYSILGSFTPQDAEGKCVYCNHCKPCPVGFGDIRLHALEAIRELNLPKYVIPLLGLCIGYPAENPGIKPRLPKETVYFEEQYQQDLEPLLAKYDKVYAHYLKERPWNSRVGNWTQLAADFYRPPYNHYPEIPEMLRQQGFFSGNLDVNACQTIKKG